MPKEKDSGRKRTLRACTVCSRRRKKCDGKEPVCSACADSGRVEECTYSTESRKCGPTAGYVNIAHASTARAHILECVFGHLILSDPAFSTFLQSNLNNSFIAPSQSSDTHIPREEDLLDAWKSTSFHQWINAKQAQLLSAQDFKSRLATSSSPTPMQSHDVQISSNATNQNSVNFADDNASLLSTHAPVRRLGDPADYTPLSFQNLRTSPSQLRSVNINKPTTSYAVATSLQGPIITQQYPGEDHLEPMTPYHVVQGPSSCPEIFRPSGTFTSSPFFRSNHYFSTYHQNQFPQTCYAYRRPDFTLSLSENDFFDIVNIFFRVTHLTLPMVDKEKVLLWSEDHYDPDAKASRSNGEVAPQLILAILACGAATAQSRRLAISQSVQQIDPFKLALQSLDHIKADIDYPSLETIQAQIILALFYLQVGLPLQSANRIASAIPFAYTLGINDSNSEINQNYASSRSYDQIVPRTWWSLIIVDACIGLRNGTCPLIHVEDHDQRLPDTSGPEELELWTPARRSCGDRSRIIQRDGSDLSSRPKFCRVNALSTLRELARLSVIGSKIARRLNSQSVEEPIVQSPVMECMDELERWYNELPPQLRIKPKVLLVPQKMELWTFYYSLRCGCARQLRRSDEQFMKISKECSTFILDLSSSYSLCLGSPLLEHNLVVLLSMLPSSSPPSEVLCQRQHNDVYEAAKVSSLRLLSKLSLCQPYLLHAQEMFQKHWNINVGNDVEMNGQNMDREDETTSLPVQGSEIGISTMHLPTPSDTSIGNTVPHGEITLGSASDQSESSLQHPSTVDSTHHAIIPSNDTPRKDPFEFEYIDFFGAENHENILLGLGLGAPPSRLGTPSTSNENQLLTKLMDQDKG